MQELPHSLQLRVNRSYACMNDLKNFQVHFRSVLNHNIDSDFTNDKTDIGEE